MIALLPIQTTAHSHKHSNQTACSSSLVIGIRNGGRHSKIPASKPELCTSTSLASELGHIARQAREHTNDMGQGKGDAADGRQADHIGEEEQRDSKKEGDWHSLREYFCLQLQRRSPWFAHGELRVACIGEGVRQLTNRPRHLMTSYPNSSQPFESATRTVRAATPASCALSPSPHTTKRPQPSSNLSTGRRTCVST